MRNEHWLHALTAATTIVSFGPRSRSDAKSTAYDTDIVEPLRASGRLTLKTEVTDDRVSRSRKSQGSAKVRKGKNTASSPRPTAMTAKTNRRAPIGNAFIAWAPVRVFARLPAGGAEAPGATPRQRMTASAFHS